VDTSRTCTGVGLGQGVGHRYRGGMRSLWPLAVLVLLGGTSPLTNDTIRVQRLELVDDEGRVRGVWAAEGDAAGWVLKDGAGRNRVMIAIDAAGTPSVIIYDDQKNMRVKASISGQSGGAVAVFGKETAAGTSGAMLSAGDEAFPVLNFFENSSSVVSLGMWPSFNGLNVDKGDGSASLLAFDGAAEARFGSAGAENVLGIEDGKAISLVISAKKKRDALRSLAKPPKVREVRIPSE
jgi:hypothetical protein